MSEPALSIPSGHIADERGDSPSRRISEATVVRLPVYQRILAELLRNGVSTVSSGQLATLAGVNAAKVRKDLSLLGSFGTRGTGYDSAFLIAQIDRALGLGQEWPLVVVGIGNLGRALVNSEGFSSRGFRVIALFDVDPSVVGQRVGTETVRHAGELATLAIADRPPIGVVSTPAAAAQEVVDTLVAIGVKSILNFAPRVLRVPPDVLLRYVDLSVELQVLTFYQSRISDGESSGPVDGEAGRSADGVARGVAGEIPVLGSAVPPARAGGG